VTKNEAIGCQRRRELEQKPLNEQGAKLPGEEHVGIGLTAADAVGLGLDTYFTVNADWDPRQGASQQEVAAQNDHEPLAEGLVGSFVAGAADGLAVIFWPTRSVRLGASATPGGAFANLSGRL
jgi:hypothetical protein